MSITLIDMTEALIERKLTRAERAILTHAEASPDEPIVLRRPRYRLTPTERRLCPARPKL